jgi:enoyl-CoA hydratase
MSIDFEVSEPHIAVITLNRPEKRNALDAEHLAALGEAWRRVRDEPDVWCAIVTGAGDRAFCAGGDLKTHIPTFTGGASSDVADETRRRPSSRVENAPMLRAFDLYKPVIAAVNGICVAGGMELLAGTDLRVASENAEFGITEVRWSLFPGGGSTVRYPRQLAYCHAMELLLLGDRISANDALRMGIVNRVVPLPALMDAALTYARVVVRNGPVATQAIKEAVLREQGVPTEQAYFIERHFSRHVFESEDAKEGPHAFAEKREPRYTGR